MLLLLRPVLLRSVIAVLMFLRDDTIRNRLKNFGVGDVQSALNQMLKDKIKCNAGDYIYNAFYGCEATFQTHIVVKY